MVDPERGDEADPGGDPACWADRLCPDCGAVVEDERASTCPRCGRPAPTHVDPA